MDKKCLFCKIVKGEIQSEIVYRDEDVVAFKDVSPMAPIHYLFVPTKHVDSLAHLDNADVMAKLYAAVLKVAQREGVKESGFRTVINTGKEGGQTVFHLHIHLLAKQTMSHKFA